MPRGSSWMPRTCCGWKSPCTGTGCSRPSRQPQQAVVGAHPQHPLAVEVQREHRRRPAPNGDWMRPSFQTTRPPAGADPDLARPRPGRWRRPGSSGSPSARVITRSTPSFQRCRPRRVPNHMAPVGSSLTDSMDSPATPGGPYLLLTVRSVNWAMLPARVPTHRLPSRSSNTAVTSSSGSPSALVYRSKRPSRKRSRPFWAPIQTLPSRSSSAVDCSVSVHPAGQGVGPVAPVDRSGEACRRSAPTWCRRRPRRCPGCARASGPAAAGELAELAAALDPQAVVRAHPQLPAGVPAHHRHAGERPGQQVRPAQPDRGRRRAVDRARARRRWPPTTCRRGRARSRGCGRCTGTSGGRGACRAPAPRPARRRSARGGGRRTAAPGHPAPGRPGPSAARPRGAGCGRRRSGRCRRRRRSTGSRPASGRSGGPSCRSGRRAGPTPRPCTPTAPFRGPAPGPGAAAAAAPAASAASPSSRTPVNRLRHEGREYHRTGQRTTCPGG